MLVTGTLMVAALVPSLVAISPAQAEPTYTRSFSSSVSHVVAGRCVIATLSGQMRFQLDSITGRGVTARFYVNRKVRYPKVVVKTYRAPCRSGNARRAITKLQITQRWSDHNCNGNLSVSVGVPWSLSVGATPSCGREERAVRSTTYEANASYYSQKNSDTVVSYANKGSIHDPQAGSSGPGGTNRIPLCQTAQVQFVLYPTRSTSDSWTRTFTPCVKWW
ncbi:hypothetical protein SAMN05428985_107184 [Nocardioides sp. YR527]|nr:hypothetical protein SAMN05428985_107184 [Nocardioides sp. YR527]